MLSEAQQRRVWEGWLGAETRGLYFAELGATLQRRHQTLTIAGLVLASGALVAVLARLPDTWAALGPVLALVATGLNGYVLVTRLQDSQADCRVLYRRWNGLAQSYGTLWEDQHAADALDRLDSLDREAIALGETAIGLPWREDRLAHWQEHVVREHHAAPA